MFEFGAVGGDGDEEMVRESGGDGGGERQGGEVRVVGEEGGER